MVIFISITSCQFPQEPKNSWKKATTQGLKVGVVVHPPFTEETPDGLIGREVEWVKAFSQANNLQVEYETGSETELVKKLKNYQYHLIIGGFEKKSVWKKKVGMTIPYDLEKKRVFFIPKGENELLWHVEDYIYKHR